MRPWEYGLDLLDDTGHQDVSSPAKCLAFLLIAHRPLIFVYGNLNPGNKLRRPLDFINRGIVELADKADRVVGTWGRSEADSQPRNTTRFN